MSSVTFDLREWDRWLNTTDLLPVLKKGIHAGAMRGKTYLQEQVRKAPPASRDGGIGAFNTGAYARAWKTSKQAWGTLLYNDKPYSPVIEHGGTWPQSPPPRKPLAQWAQRKLGMSKDSAWGFAYVASRNIKKRGLRARNVLKSALPEIKKMVLKEIKFEVDKYFVAGKL